MLNLSLSGHDPKRTLVPLSQRPDRLQPGPGSPILFVHSVIRGCSASKTRVNASDEFRRTGNGANRMGKIAARLLPTLSGRVTRILPTLRSL